jgi:valyl-tRNA synthetase
MLGGGLMRYSQLSGQQILLALSESHNVIAAITKYQASLASSAGLPKDDAARIELMAANLKVIDKIQTEIRALEHELDRQESAEKSRY